MKVFVINPILFTVERDGVFPSVKTIKDTMIYGICLGLKQNGHSVSLLTTEDYKPSEEERYDFEVIFFKSNLRHIARPERLPLSFDMFQYLIQYYVNFIFKSLKINNLY